MARAYSNGNGYSSSPYGSSSSSHYSYDAHPSRRHDESIWDDIYNGSRLMLTRLWRYCSGPGWVAAMNFTMQTAQQLRRNLSWRRVLSFPHLVVMFWVVVMLWGEKWVFSSRVAGCDWDHWEKWVSPCICDLFALGAPFVHFTDQPTSSAFRCETPSTDLRRRSPDHRSAFVPRATLASEPYNHHNHGQLRAAIIHSDAEKASAGYSVLPRRPVRRRKGVENGSGRL